MLLGRKKDDYEPSFFSFLDALEIIYLDLHDTIPEGFYNDEHPNPADHRWIAKQIAHSPIARLLPDTR